MRHVIRRAEHYSDYEEPTDPYHKLGKPNSVTGTNTGTTSPSSGSCRGSRTPAANIAKTQSTQPAGKGRAKNPPDCLNPSFSLKHYLRECHNTIQEQKDELYAELAERRKNNGEQRSTRRDTGAIQNIPSNVAAAGRQAHQSGGAKSVRAVGPPPACRVKVSFQSAVDCIALPDSGADDNVIPRSLVERLEESGLFIPMWQHAHRGRKECVGETVFGPKGQGKKRGVKEPTPRKTCTRSRGPVGSEGSARYL
jgi:hypothetical protein